MLNLLVTGIEVILMAVAFALTSAIRQERADFDDTAPRWLSAMVRYTGPLTKLGRRLWWIRTGCIALMFATIIFLHYET